MKKKLFIGTIVPSIAALGVIGSGFALWIFDDSNTATGTGSVNLTVEKAVSVGSIEVTGSTLLKLDQSVTELNSKGLGAHFVIGNNETAHQKATYTFSSDDDYVIGYEEGNTDITFTTTITVPTALNEYVTLSAENLSKSSNVYTYTFKASEVENFDVNSQVMFDFADVKVAYAEGKEPSSLTAYKEFKDAVKDCTISVNYSAVVSINA